RPRTCPMMRHGRDSRSAGRPGPDSRQTVPKPLLWCLSCPSGIRPGTRSRDWPRQVSGKQLPDDEGVLESMASSSRCPKRVAQGEGSTRSFRRKDGAPLSSIDDGRSEGRVVDDRPAILQIVPAMPLGGMARSTLDVAEALIGAGARAIVASAGGLLVHQLQRIG